MQQEGRHRDKIETERGPSNQRRERTTVSSNKNREMGCYPSTSIDVSAQRGATYGSCQCSSFVCPVNDAGVVTRNCVPTGGCGTVGIGAG